MRLIAGVLSHLRNLLRRGPEDDETAEELRFHLEMEAEKNEREGLSPEEAYRRARVRLGGVDAIREAVRRPGPSRRRRPDAGGRCRPARGVRQRHGHAACPRCGATPGDRRAARHRRRPGTSRPAVADGDLVLSSFGAVAGLALAWSLLRVLAMMESPIRPIPVTLAFALAPKPGVTNSRSRAFYRCEHNG